MKSSRNSASTAPTARTSRERSSMQMRHEAFLVAHAAGFGFFGLCLGLGSSAGPLRACLGRLVFCDVLDGLVELGRPVWLSSASVLLTSALHRRLELGWLPCCIESRILRSSSSSTSRLMSALTSAT
jgi:hypothetical protein